MEFQILWTEEAGLILEGIEGDPAYAAKLKKIRKAVGQLQRNPRHPGLNTHEYSSLQGPQGEKIWEAYVENHTPTAWRIWFWYGPERQQITILTLGPHPD